MTRLDIIDALGPFVVDKPGRDVVNWSKVIFSDLETNGHVTHATRQQVIANFESYISKVSSLGYDSVSLDDLAHLVSHPFYNPSLTQLLGEYRALYKQLFAIAKKHHMKVFVNTDYLFFNDDIRHYLSESGVSTEDFYRSTLELVMSDYPEIDGVILRVGEHDGKDVTGHFLSQLLLKTPRQANKLIRKILPLFEQHKKLLIFRTWTVGAYKIGDLIWNEKTYDKVFSMIDSDSLVISMKFGDTDFMRYLKLNPLLISGRNKVLIELQTRREWEGMGMYPSFVGWDYASYLSELSASDNFVGIHVWCQTGGWAKSEWSNVTYLKNSSFWNELNTEVTVDIARYGVTVEKAIERFCQRRDIADTHKFTQLLRYCEIAIKKGLYISDLARRELFFRRTRIPPLMWVTWDRIHIPPTVVYLHRMLLPRTNKVAQEGLEAVDAVDQAISIASELHLGDQQLQSLYFEKDTLLIFAQLRRYILQALTGSELRDINAQIKKYQQKYPQHYSIPALVPAKSRWLPSSLLAPFIRDSLRYRKRDRIFLKTSPLQAKLIRYYLKKSKSYLAEQSMGFDTLFK